MGTVIEYKWKFDSFLECLTSAQKNRQYQVDFDEGSSYITHRNLCQEL